MVGNVAKVQSSVRRECSTKGNKIGPRTDACATPKDRGALSDTKAPVSRVGSEAVRGSTTNTQHVVKPVEQDAVVNGVKS